MSFLESDIPPSERYIYLEFQEHKNSNNQIILWPYLQAEDKLDFNPGWKWGNKSYQKVWIDTT